MKPARDSKEPTQHFDQKDLSSILEIIAWRVANTPDNIAYTFLADGEKEEEHLTYSDLNQCAKRIARLILSQCKCGDRVILSFNHGLDFIKSFYGCLYAGVIAVPSVPPKSSRSLDRLANIMEDAGATVILSHSALALGKRASFFDERRYTLIQVDETKEGSVTELPAADATRSTLAFLQYTSGSTGSPKGVMVTHGNILHNVDLISRVFRQDADSIILSWLPFYHDMGLIGGVLVPLFTGARAVLMAPLHFTQKPLRWLQAIHRYKATTSGGPNFGFELCAGIKPEELTGIDLSSWQVAFVGAEPVRMQTLRNFSNALKPFGFDEKAFQPCYGMAETTLLISAGNYQAGVSGLNYSATLAKQTRGVEGKESGSIVSCGAPTGFELLVVNEKGEVLPEMEVGEIVVAGPSVAAGYWNKPELTRQTFHFSAGGKQNLFFKTGDLGLVKDGHVYITGRLKDIVIVNGRNLYPQDIEFSVTGIPQLVKDGCAAFSVSVNEKEELVIVAEISGQANDELFNRVKEVVYEEFEIFPTQIVFIRRGTIPKTTSGKIQRHACKSAWLENSLLSVASWSSGDAALRSETSFEKPVDENNKIKETVNELLASLIGNKVAGDNPNLFTLGMNSIKLTQFVLLLNDEFNIDIPIEFIFENPELNSVCAQVELMMGGAAKTDGLELVPASAYYPLSPLQHGIWFDQELKAGGNSYHIPVCSGIQRLLDPERLTRIMNGLIAENEILRTTFQLRDGVPAQVIIPKLEISAELEDCSALTEPEKAIAVNNYLTSKIHQYFDTVNGPLMRYGIVKTSPSECRLYVVAHHLILDGTALFQLFKELHQRYEQAEASVTFSMPKFQYKDYTAWINKHIETNPEARNYWYNKFSDGFTPFRPSRSKTDADAGHAGRSRTLVIGEGLTSAIQLNVRDAGSTTYSFLLSSFVILMHRITAKKEIIIGVPVSGRERVEFLAMYGAFINAVLVPVKINKQSTYQTILDDVRTELFDALKYQDYPLHLLAKELKLSGSPQSGGFTSVFFNGLGFIDKELAASAFESFSTNYGLDMNLDLNAYVFETGPTISIRLDYKTSVFDDQAVGNLLDNYLEIINEALTQPGASVYGPSVGMAGINEGELRERTKFSNGSAVEIPEETITAQIERKAFELAHNTAVVFKNEWLTYEKLNGKANSLAYKLAEAGIGERDFVPLLMTKSIELPLSILSILKLGAAFVPLDTGWPTERIKLLLDRLSPKLVLSNGETVDEALRNDYRIVTVNQHGLDSNPRNPSVRVSLNSPIYGMYTSGTTGIPKCAINLHKGILNRFTYMNKIYGCTPHDTILFTSRHIYDASVWQMFWPLTNGARTIIPDDTFGLDLHEIINLVEKEKVTVTDFVPSVFNIFVDYVESDSNAAPRVASLRQLLIGGEAMQSHAIRRFRKINPAVGITNTYGPTEASIGTIFYEVPEQIPDVIPIGKPIDNVKALLLDDDLLPVPLGETGELYLGGVCLGTGYLNDKERTDMVFIENPLPHIDSDFLYKTGDIASYLPDGNLHYMGRADTQVKINGIRVECSEIENTLLMHEAVKEAVVLCKQDDAGKNFLVGILRLSNEDALTAVQDFLRRQLPAFMIPKGFALIDKFPKTLNGKADRKELDKLGWQRSSHLRGEASIKDETELKLSHIWKDLLGNDQLSSESDFFESGGDSLKAMQLLTRIHKAFNVSVTLRELFFNSTIQTQALVINKHQKNIYKDIVPAAKASDGMYELSHSQKRLWILSKFPETGSAYNMPAVVELEGALNTGALEKSFQLIYERHESLRTFFAEVAGIPYQVITAPGQFLVKHTVLNDKRKLNIHLSDEMMVPFDLEKGPLVRAELINLAPDRHILLLVMHHIISDGWSMGVLVEELLKTYGALVNNQPHPLKPLKIQYKDFAAWQTKLSKDEALEGHRTYWLKQFEGELPVLELPADRARPAVKTYDGGKVIHRINQTTLGRLKGLAGERKSSLFMSLLALVNAMFNRYTGQEDIILGTPHAGREHADLEGQVGFYVNTLALRTRFSSKDSYLSLLEKVKAVALGAFEHQAYPFDKLVDELALPRNRSRNPIFDVLVVLQNAGMDADYNKFLPASTLQVKNYLEAEHVISKFDLAFTFSELKDGLQLVIEFNSDLYDKGTISRMCCHFENLLLAVVTNPTLPVNDYDYIGEEEKKQLLYAFNDTKSFFQEKETLVSLFEKQVKKSSQKVALVHKNVEFTYGDLNEKANQLAGHLKTVFNVGLGDIVGIKLERSEWMLIGLLAVLKAGAAYLPIDPEYPDDRVNYLLEDSKCKALIDVKELDTFLAVRDNYHKDNLPVASGPDSLAYIIYTSGSTGRPKGCMLQNKGVVNRIDWMWNEYGFSPQDIVLQKTTFTFDVSVWEIFMPLCWGCKMVLCEREDIASPERILNLIDKNKISCLHFVPSVLNAFVIYLSENKGAKEQLASLTGVVTSGEALPLETVKQWYKYSDAPIHNLYGPTEASVDVTYYETSVSDTKIPIGRPIWNTQMYVLDEQLRLMPIGAFGEICIGGIGLAKGYINKTELTSERFVANPFVPGERIYKTGDLGRWLPDGNIEYLGRRDTQVKIRGYRIELGEIENCIQQVPGVHQAIVLSQTAGSDPALYAYVSVSSGVSEETLRDWLKTRLPGYMIPVGFVFVDEIPLNSNGKADRKKVAELYKPGSLQKTFVEPSNDDERRLAAIWCEVLKLDKVSVTENFFSLGGNSLNATQVISRVRDEFKVELPFKALFDDPTIASIIRIVKTLDVLEEDKIMPIKRVAR